MAINTYETAELVGLIERPATQPDNFWLRFFPRVFTSDKESILFDEIPFPDRRLAPFVAPMTQGRVMTAQGYNTKSFKPAYVKPKHVVTPHQAIPRMPGEPLMGALSAQQRMDRLVADRLMLHRQMIERRIDWMAAQAIIDGQVTVSGDDYPTTVIAYGRDASLTYTLSGGARWNQSTPNPLADIKAARVNCYNLSGYPVRDLIFGLGAWELFTANADVKALLNNQVRGGSSDFTAANIGDGLPFQYEGEIIGANGNGRMRLWTYANYFTTDAAGTQRVQYLNTNTVVGVSAVEGVQAFGRIADIEAGMQPLPMFPKTWVEKDPSGLMVLTQSAPLPVPMRPNASFKIVVA